MRTRDTEIIYGDDITKRLLDFWCSVDGQIEYSNADDGCRSPFVQQYYIGTYINRLPTNVEVAYTKN